jgi:hypothetical protein
MADPYANIANQYAQEQEFGTRLYSGLDQQRAQAPNQLFDRFMSAYQMQLQQKRAEEEMRRKQQHEDTYLKMAQDREANDASAGKAKFAEWVNSNYKEGENDKVAEMLGRSVGYQPEEIAAMLPKGIKTPAVIRPDTATLPDAGGLPGETITLEPDSPSTSTPGMGALRGRNEAEAGRKQLKDDRDYETKKIANQIRSARQQAAEELNPGKKKVLEAHARSLEANARRAGYMVDEYLPQVLEIRQDQTNIAGGNLEQRKVEEEGRNTRGEKPPKASDPLDHEAKILRVIKARQAGVWDSKKLAQIEADTRKEFAGGGSAPAPKAPKAASKKVEAKRQFSPSTGKTKIIYTDGTFEIQ